MEANNINKSKTITAILISIFILFSINNAKAQRVYKDRVSLKSGIVLFGDVIELQEKSYLIIQTDSLGKIKVNFRDIKFFLKKPNTNEPFYKKGGEKYVSVAAGAGMSYGGYGIRFQQRTGRRVGFGYHIALGVNHFKAMTRDTILKYDTYAPALTIGLKFFFYKWFYLNPGAQFYKITNERSHDFEDRIHLMIGSDYFITNKLGFNIAAGIASMRIDNMVLKRNQICLDIGFVYRIGKKTH